MLLVFVPVKNQHLLRFLSMRRDHYVQPRLHLIVFSLHCKKMNAYFLVDSGFGLPVFFVFLCAYFWASPCDFSESFKVPDFKFCCWCQYQ